MEALEKANKKEENQSTVALLPLDNNLAALEEPGGVAG